MIVAGQAYHHAFDDVSLKETGLPLDPIVLLAQAAEEAAALDAELKAEIALDRAEDIADAMDEIDITEEIAEAKAEIAEDRAEDIADAKAEIMDILLEVLPPGLWRAKPGAEK